MIRKATAADIDRVEEIYNAHLDFEERTENRTNWHKGVYPLRANAENALKNDWLWVGEDEDGIWGAVIFNHVQMKEYYDMPWRFPEEDGKVFVIHTLVIDPERRGQGKATEILNAAEDIARSIGCTVMRIDTWAGNIPAQTLYQKQGYAIVGGCDTWFANAYISPLVFLDKQL